ncbi:disulfide bond formation protein B [Novosphingobium sp.]|uniref:disulfide bond formation protein B n=1 Tax=Novosphingobium sp. TaxID=1874826 RepID=UPI0025CCA009|nr:disulfide bond formation protein B [Novosphingobium sp.]MCC6926481.1 disulfide bond formation protein B [Novosphingobium sp.]
MSRPNDNQAPQPKVPVDDAIARDGRAWACLFLAWGIATISALGVLFVGEVMGQTPCSLCWFQRAFMFPLAVILGIAALRSDFTIWRYAMALAGLGAFVALYHSLVYVGVIAESLAPCSQGVSCASADMTIFGVLPLPFLALGAFLGIAALMYFSNRKAES